MPAIVISNGQQTAVTLPAVINGDELDPCVARRPPLGPCEPYLTRWTFDLGTKLCREYKTSYDAGDKTYNNFESLQECQTKCSKHIPTERYLPISYFGLF